MLTNDNITFEKLPEAVAYLINRVEVLTELIKTEPTETTTKKNDLLTIPEACKLMKISRGTLYRWEQRGSITFYGIGGRRYLKKDELLTALTARK